MHMIPDYCRDERSKILIETVRYRELSYFSDYVFKYEAQSIIYFFESFGYAT